MSLRGDYIMSNEFKDWYSNFSDEQKKNYELCMKYPILIPKNVWTGKEVEDYDYEYTMLDFIPDGWRIAFGEEWAKEVQDAINEPPEDNRDEIYITQLKEKFGQFRQYFNCYTDKLNAVVCKYEDLSIKTCIRCGNSATKVSTGWISSFCDNCAKETMGFGDFVDIDEWIEGDYIGNN